MCSPPSGPSSSIISINMTDEDIIARVASIFGVSYCFVKARKSHHKHSYSTRLQGKRAIELMIKLHPLMGVRRKLQIDIAIESHHLHKKILLTEQNADFIYDSASRGETHVNIAKKIGVERSTITKFLKRKGLQCLKH